MRTLFRLAFPSAVVVLGVMASAPPGTDFTNLDRRAEPLRSAFNHDSGKVRIVMYVAPTCGGCLRGVEQLQERVLSQIDHPDLAGYIVWAPRNGARERHVQRVTRLATDPRTTHYWDGYAAVANPVDDMLSLTGPCAGIFMIYGRDARWDGNGPPMPDHWEDAHESEFHRGGPQLDARRFAEQVLGALE